MDPEYLAHLFMVGINKQSYKSSTANVKDKYYELCTFPRTKWQGAREERGHGGGISEQFCHGLDASLGSWARCAAVGVRHNHTRYGLLSVCYLSMVISELKRRGGG
jgi:hypothetical protein